MSLDLNNLFSDVKTESIVKYLAVDAEKTKNLIHKILMDNVPELSTFCPDG